MMFVCFILGAVLVVSAVGLLVRGLRGLSIVRRVIRRPTVPVARLHEGAVEIAGTITAVEEPLISLSGHRCVAVKTIVNGQSVDGEDSTHKGENTRQRAVRARVVDATGACLLDLELAQIVGEHWRSTTIKEAELAYATTWSELIPEGANEVTVDEHIIPEGAKVLVTGGATLVAKNPSGYREGAGEEWVLSGTEDELLVLSVGGQARLIGRSVAIVAIVVAAGGYLAALGALIIAVVLAG